MKILIIVPLFLASCFRMIAQPPAPGTNELNNYINKFEGTWQWVNGNDTIIIKLKKFNTDFSNYQKDVLFGVHKYVKNGTIIHDALNRFGSIGLNYKKSTVLLSNELGTDTSKVDGNIKDLTKKKINNLILEYVAGTPPTIIWHLETAEGTFIDPTFQYGLTMPKDIILIKQ